MSKPNPDPHNGPPRIKSAGTTETPTITSKLGSIRTEAPTLGTSSKAIGNVVAKSEGPTPSVTRQGAPKMTFLPKRPVRRNVQLEQTAQAGPSTESGESRGRGRGRGLGRGAGRGRGGGFGAREDSQMVASGPFALGPAAAGSTSSFSRKPQSSFSSVGLGGVSMASLGAGLSGSAAPPFRKGMSHDELMEEVEDNGVLSDDEHGVEKVDMDHVARLDWHAPVALRKEKDTIAAKKEDRGTSQARKVKSEPPEELIPGVQPRSRSANTDNDIEVVEETKDFANALDLSESEEEEEPEDLVEYFTRQNQEDADADVGGERLYFFQFPSPFPAFLPASDPILDEDKTKAMEVDPKGKGKAVSWAPGVKDEPAAGSKPVVDNKGKSAETKKGLEGIIGQMEMYKSGAVKIRLGNNILMDVIPATQPSFLQKAVYLDLNQKRMAVLGDVTRRFIVCPDVDMLLDELDGGKVEAKPDPAFDGLTAMDVDS